MKYIIGSKSIFTVFTCLLLFASSPVQAGDAEANELLVEAVQSIQLAGRASDLEHKLSALNKAVENLERIISDHPSSGLAVSLITGQAIGNVDLIAIRGERDQFQAEVDTLLAQSLAEEEAKTQLVEANERNVLWVRETIACIEDLDCATYLLWEHSGKTTKDIGILFELANLEVMRNGYSSRFRAMLEEIIDQIDGVDQLLSFEAHFSNLLNSGILQETPIKVFQTIQTFAASHFPTDAKGIWQKGSQKPAKFALLLSHPKKSDDYLSFLVSEGELAHFETARDELFLQEYDVSFDKYEKLSIQGVWDNSNSTEEKRLYKVFAVNGDPAFEAWFKLHFKRVDFDELRQERIFYSWLLYHFSSGNAETAIDEILTWQKSNGSSDPWMLGNYVIGIAMRYSDQATKNAIRSYLKAVLEQTRMDDLNFDRARMLIVASYILQ